MQRKKHALLWFTAGLLFCLLIFLTVFRGLAGKVLVTDPEGIPKAADRLMHCIHSGDWETLEEIVSGNPPLAPVQEAEGSAEDLLWEAYRKTLQWSCTESFTTDGSCVIQPITVTCLDIAGAAKAAANLSEDSGLLQAEAIAQILGEAPPMLTREIQLTFLREKGQWLLVPDRALLTLLSGFTLR